MYDRLTHAPLQTIHAENFTILTVGREGGAATCPPHQPRVLLDYIQQMTFQFVNGFLVANIENVGTIIRELE
jgi:hypothetical protein